MNSIKSPKPNSEPWWFAELNSINQIRCQELFAQFRTAITDMERYRTALVCTLDRLRRHEVKSAMQGIGATLGLPTHMCQQFTSVPEESTGDDSNKSRGRQPDETLGLPEDPRESWLPIETAPKKGAVHLGYQHMQGFDVIAHWSATMNDWSLTGEDGRLHGRPAPSHWRPLPRAPGLPVEPSGYNMTSETRIMHATLDYLVRCIDSTGFVASAEVAAVLLALRELKEHRSADETSGLTVQQQTHMLEMVRELVGVSKSQTWWETPNPMLGNVRPWFMALSGEERSRKLYAFINEAFLNCDTLMPPEEPTVTPTWQCPICKNYYSTARTECPVCGPITAVKASAHRPNCMCEICQDERSGSGNC